MKSPLTKSLRKVFQYLLFFSAIAISSCRPDDIIESGTVELRLSEDTLIFDTVFTTVGSITLVMQVYNDYDNDIRISKLRLAKGNSSYFRLNVDGLPGREFTNVEIPAHDSIFIFCEVTIDPNITTTPYIVNDSIVFTTNGSQQDVDLGRDHEMARRFLQLGAWNDFDIRLSAADGRERYC